MAISLTAKTVFAVAAAAVLTLSCKKPVFVPEDKTPPVETDDPGVYEEGFYVTESGAGMFTGEDWANAFSAADLRNLLLADGSGNFSAEQAARINGKIIHLEEGIYPMSTAVNPSSKMSGSTAPWSVTIKGGYKNGSYTQYPDRHPTYLSGGSDRRIVEIGTGVSITLDAVGFTGGLGKESGQAAVLVNGGSVKVVNSRIMNNYSAFTAGVIQVSAGGKFKAENCVFVGNVAGAGGVLNVDGDASSCILTACTFSSNASSGQGGAIKVTDGFLYAKDCTFRGNHSETKGGSLWLSGSRDDGAVLFEECVFDGNSSVNGGGVCYMDGGATASFKGCTFTDNIASSGSGGSFYADYGADNLLIIEDCRFSGNHGGPYNGGSLYLRGNSAGRSVLRCSGCSFDGEWGGSNGGLVAVGGSLAEAYFDRCSVRNCHAAKNSAAFYNYSNSGRIYFNSCSFEDNYIEGTYGTEAATSAGNQDIFVGMNNCSVKGSYTVRPDATSQQACWYNVSAAGKYTFSNCSFIGVPTVEDREMSRFGLVRFNHDDVSACLVNNIIVSTAGDGYGLFGGDSQTSLSLTGSYNLMSPVTSQTSGAFTYTAGPGDRLTTYLGDLPNLYWDGTAWNWDASSLSGLAATADVNAAIEAFDAVFHSWLGSIGALGRDINGKERGSNSWPGAYQN
ncbi:MAG: right-handed parallel beta-helix repeat-containing protein [Bacteroidales bacterium]|nr:right-handed parallel beta-helix repeat-containing protein [Bacteroidales bacterium]